MRILVTGGAGFIGSHLCERLLEHNHTLIIVDDLNSFYSPAEKRHNIELVLGKGPAVFREADICDMGAMLALAEQYRPEAIIHLAARAGVQSSLINPLEYERTNVHGTLVLLEITRKVGIGKFLFASSSSVYGAASGMPSGEDMKTEFPISPYAATKIAGEKLCFTYSHLYGISVVCLRFFTVYGPRQRPDLAIHKFSRLMMEGSAISVFGDGSNARDYTYYADIVQGIIAALTFTCSYEAFNLGNSQSISLSTVIRNLELSLEVNAKIEHLPLQAGDVPITCADITKAQRLLGYEPQMPFAYGIELFVEWYKTTEHFLANRERRH